MWDSDIESLLNPEAKSYQTEGTATLSVQQLIDMQVEINNLKNAIIELQADKNKANSERWKAEDALQKATAENAALKEKLDGFMEWLDSDETSKTTYRLYVASKLLAEKEEDD